MNPKLTRRQFNQLAAISTAAAAVGVFASRTLAQTPTVILGVRPGPITSTNDSERPEIDSTDETDETTSTDRKVASTLRPLVVQSLVVGGLLNVVNVRVETQLTTPPILEFGEQLSGFASLRNGTLVVATTSLDTSKRADEPTRLIILSASPRIVTVSGLKKQETLISLFARKDGSLGGLVGKRNSTPPFTIVSINPDTGEITDENKLSGNQRVTNVAQCPDGNLYGIAVERKGETSLELIDDKGNKKDQTPQLRFNDQPWNSGFSGLVCSPSNQLFALGARRYETPFYIHTIDKNTGVITRIKDFDVAKFAIQFG